MSVALAKRDLNTLPNKYFFVPRVCRNVSRHQSWIIPVSLLYTSKKGLLWKRNALWGCQLTSSSDGLFFLKTFCHAFNKNNFVDKNFSLYPDSFFPFIRQRSFLFCLFFIQNQDLPTSFYSFIVITLHSMILSTHIALDSVTIAN